MRDEKMLKRKVIGLSVAAVVATGIGWYLRFRMKKTVSKPKKLIVLDVSGVLCGKEKDFNAKHPNLELVHTTRNYCIYLRPGAKEFINGCLANYDVGIFSSTTFPNVKPVLGALLTYDERKKLKFVWCRDRCELDPDYGKDKSVTKYDTIKRLERIISDPYINSGRKYTLEDLLMIDDSKRKMRLNPVGTYTIIKEFNLDPDDIVLDELWVELEFQRKCSLQTQ